MKQIIIILLLQCFFFSSVAQNHYYEDKIKHITTEDSLTTPCNMEKIVSLYALSHLSASKTIMDLEGRLKVVDKPELAAYYESSLAGYRGLEDALKLIRGNIALCYPDATPREIQYVDYEIAIEETAWKAGVIQYERK